MSGSDTPTPTDIRIHQRSRQMQISFDNGSHFELPFEYLRVYSPSAEVRGHREGEAVLQTGKRDVEILAIEPVGSYAVKLVFSDGHDTGLYSWDVLYTLGNRQHELWADYLRLLDEAGASRDVDNNPQRPVSKCSRYRSEQN